MGLLSLGDVTKEKNSYIAPAIILLPDQMNLFYVNFIASKEPHNDISLVKWNQRYLKGLASIP